MPVFRIDPIRDPRWAEFLSRHPGASVFHTPGWLEALRRTYGYEPVAFATSPPNAELRSGMVFCRINSWLTGRRLVSLPFSDHCEPLFERSEDLQDLLESLLREQTRENWKYIELRPVSSDLNGRGAEGNFQPAQTFCLHRLDLRRSTEELLQSFHKDSVQRKIRRAEREELTHEEGHSETLVHKFHHLLVRTRRRHQLPPPPLDWFRNLVDCLGDKLKITMASKNGEPLASILTLWYKDSVVYKNGCSDERFHALGGMASLFWKAIQQGKNDGLREFDLGRSDKDNPGLIVFKERWGATRYGLTYWRYPPCPYQTTSTTWQMRMAKRVFARAPDGFLVASGKLLYRHIG